MQICGKNTQNQDSDSRESSTASSFVGNYSAAIPPNIWLPQLLQAEVPMFIMCLRQDRHVSVAEVVYRVRHHQVRHKRQLRRLCFNYNRACHIAKSSSCPAKDKRSNKYGKKRNFSVCCQQTASTHQAAAEQPDKDNLFGCTTSTEAIWEWEANLFLSRSMLVVWECRRTPELHAQ